MASVEQPATIAVEVAYAAAPGDVRRVPLQLPHGATLADAVKASGLLAGLPSALVDALTSSIWNRKAEPAVVLRDRDRVELSRPLQVDPKEARRQRFQRDGIAPKRKAPRAQTG